MNVFIFAGQSNMTGKGLVRHLPEKFRDMAAEIRLYENGGWKNILSSQTFGPEVGFFSAISHYIKKSDLIICKRAFDGSNLFYDWSPDRKSGGSEDEYRGPLFPHLIRDLTVLRSIETKNGALITYKGLLWMQGERDSVFSSMAAKYDINLRNFIQRIRLDIDAPDLPLIIGQISPFDRDKEMPPEDHPYSESVRNAQIKIASSMPNTALVVTDDLPKIDNLHFDAEGQLELGRRFALAYMKIVEQK